MAHDCSYVRGIAVNSESHLPFPGLRVSCVVYAERRRVVLQETTTDGDGRFVVNLAEAAVLAPDPGSGKYELHFWQDGRELDVETDAPWYWYAGEELEDLVICVKPRHGCEFDAQGGDPQEYGTGDHAVSGRIRHKDGTPAVGALVHAWHAGIGAPVSLSATEAITSGGSTSDQRGWYKLHFPVGFGGPLNLFVRVKEPISGDVVGTSPVTFKAGTDVTIDVEVCDDRYRARSEYGDIDAAITPLVTAASTTFAALEAKDLLFLAGATGLEVPIVLNFVAAKRLDARLLAPAVPDRVAEHLYGLLHSGWPKSLPRLLLQRRTAIARTLRLAADANIVSRDCALDYPRVVGALRDMVFAWAINPARPGSLGALLDAEGFSTPEIGEIVNLYINNGGANAGFWTAIDDSSTLPAGPPTTQTRLRTLFVVAAIACNHVPMVAAIYARGDWTGDAALLATLDDAAWGTMIDAGVGWPPGTPDYGSGQRAAYIQILQENAESGYPARKVVAALTTSAVLSAAVKSFFAANPTFDIATEGITAALMPTATAAEVRELQAVQRLYRIAPTSGKSTSIEALYAPTSSGGLGVNSAQQVSRMGATRFIEAAATVLGGDPDEARQAAREMHRKARTLNAMATAAYTANHPNLLGPALSFLGAAPDPAGTGNPTNYSGLFGAVSYCACEQCRSVLSPASYLVDLLQWVDARGGVHWVGTSPSLRAGLTASTDPSTDTRRGDIADLKLTCENTHRALPYIDLVIEVLENAVSPTTATIPTTTDALTPDLLASPQYINEEAYDTLASATFPQCLPFDLWGEMSRTYLDHLGVPRADLMRAFESLVAGSPTAESEALEDLGISAAQADVLTGTPSDWTLWGYTTEAELLASLFQVRQLMLRGELTYADVLDLLHCRYPGLGPTYAISTADECNLDDFQILDAATATNGPTLAVWAKVSGFIRLSRAMSWSLLDTDRILTSLGVTTVADADLLELAAMRRIRRRVDVDPVVLAGWFGTMDAQDDREGKEEPILSPWERTFLNPSIFAKAEIDAQDGVPEYTFPFRLTLADPDLLVDEGGDPADHADKLKAALAIDDDDLTYASTWVGASWTLSLTTLSQLHARVSLARALGTTVRAARRYSILSGIDPFASAADALEFIESFQESAAAGFAVDELDYLCAHQHTAGDEEDDRALSLVGPTDDWKEATLGKLRDAIAPLFSALPRRDDDTRTDDDGARVRAALEEVLVDSNGNVLDATTPAPPLTLVDDVMTLLARVPGTSPPDDFYTAAERALLTTTATGETHPADLRIDADAVIERLAPASLTTSAATVLTVASDRYAFGLWLVRQYQARRDRATDDDGTLVRKALEEVILSDSGTADTDDIDAVIDVLATVPVTTSGTGVYTATDVTAITDALGTFADASQPLLDRLVPQDADIADYPLAFLATRAERYAYVLWLVRRWQARERARATVVEQLAAAFNRTREAMDELRDVTFAALDDFAPTGATSVGDYTDLLVDDDLVLATQDPGDPWGDITEGTQPAAWACVEVIYKAALVLGRLGVSVEEQAWWVADNARAAGSGANFGLLALASIPLSASTTGDATTAFDGLKAAIDLFRQRGRLPGSSPRFDEILDSALASDTLWAADGPTAATTFQADLASRTGWGEDEIDEVLDAISVTTEDTSGGGAATRVSFIDVDAFEQFVDAALLCRRAAVRASTVTTDLWCGAVPDRTSAESVQLAARSRYATGAEWSTVARPLRDRLRERQRQALVGYLLAREDATEARDSSYLYDKYLLDVDMGACMLTSRVKQAACSLQLYVQRNLMGLETEFTLNDDDREEWEWMKNYRVWEAARKVFLYPENWIEPELRDDKTPFFKSFEGDIAQGELTTELVEGATLAYLERLHEVARLHIIGYCWQKESDEEGDIDVLHVFARTQGSPAAYYYRRWEDRATWTPWERVDCGIEGEHLLPVVYNRRLMLFWAAFVQDGDTEEGADPAEWWNVQLAWSECRDGKWQPKRVGETSLSLQGAQSRGSYSFAVATYYSFYSSVDDEGDLNITLADSSGDQVGYFKLNACTMELNGYLSVVEDSHFTFNYSMNYGSARKPGSALYDAPEVALGAVDEDYEMVSTAEYVRLLDYEDWRMKFAITRQFHDFCSQTPFFIEFGERVWFIVPDTEAEISEDSASPAQIGDNDLSGEDAAETEPTDDGIPYTGDDDDLLRAGNALLEADDDQGDATIMQPTGTYRFFTHHHPYVCTLIREVRRNGILSMYLPDPTGSAAELSVQAIADTDYFSHLNPTDAVDTTHPVDDIDFEHGGAYAQYNWELFFHIPLTVATRLSDDQQFQEAMDWFHTVFDPRRAATESYTDDELWKSYWKIRPFYEEEPATAVTDWVAFTGANGDSDAAAAFERQVAEWREDPFNPHLIARLRPGVYQKAIALKYLDNLIAWGDSLFARDTIESINEATQLYVFARQILGDRPEVLPAREDPDAKSFNELSNAAAPEGIDAFSNALVTAENDLFEPSGTAYGGASDASLPNVGLTTYFCVVPNDRILKYWDVVDDRLFKIRHCMNIEGVVRQLPLFEPPIDPALLVKAAAAGLSIGAVLSDSQATRPQYRFNVVVQKAQAFVGSVKSLGQSLLSALEKKDAEALSLLRSGHEIELQDLVITVRKTQVDEASTNLQAAKRAKGNALARQKHYTKLIAKKQIDPEKQQEAKLKEAQNWQQISQGVTAIGALLSAIPQLSVGPMPAVTLGGLNISPLVTGVGAAIGMVGSQIRHDADMAGMLATRVRRFQDWTFQLTLANKDLAGLEKQEIAAEIRLAIARKELANAQKQAEHSRAVDEWMRSKFTNAELYQWMVGQVATLYFSSYQLAYEFARKAEACFQYELGVGDSYVQFGHWDGQRRGLLAGERLGHELERLEAAFLTADRREFEITKPVSLALLDPLALASLMSTGACGFELPEVLFDLDFPGHYFRRIQSVTVSIPCVGGATTRINATLTLNSSRIRTSSIATSYAEIEDDPRFSYDLREQSVVLSGSQDDGGVFQLDLKDARYLPFERRGLLSMWTLALAGSSGYTKKQLDWASITDVVVTVRYTAREGGDVLGAAAGGTAAATIKTALNLIPGGRTIGDGTTVSMGLQRVFSAKRDFPDEWFETTSATNPAFAFSAAISTALFPYFAQACTITTQRIRCYLVMSSPAAPGDAGGGTPIGTLTLGSADPHVDQDEDTVPDTLAWSYASGANYGLPALNVRLESAVTLTSTEVELALSGWTATLANLADLLIIVDYDVS